MWAIILKNLKPPKQFLSSIEKLHFYVVTSIIMIVNPYFQNTIEVTTNIIKVEFLIKEKFRCMYLLIKTFFNKRV